MLSFFQRQKSFLVFTILWLCAVPNGFSQLTVKTEYKLGAASNLYNGYGGIAIRVHYLKDGLLQKTLYFDKDSIPLPYRTHTVYNYDEKKRLVSAQDYVKEQKMNWEYAYREVKYLEGRIELIFPNAKKELDLLESIIAPPSKIILKLDSIKRIVSMEFTDFQNNPVAVSDMRITREDFFYDSFNNLREIQTLYQTTRCSKIIYTVLDYKSNSKQPFVQKITESEDKFSFDILLFFYYSTQDKDMYTTSKMNEASPVLFEKFGAQTPFLECLTYPHYGDSGNKFNNIYFESEIRAIWMNH
jgi:hypothetical protein